MTGAGPEAPPAIPELRTARTTMRAWREHDLDAFAEIAADPEVMRYVGGVATRAEAWRSIAAHLGHWHLRGYGTWAVERRDDGALLGRVGLWNPEGWFGREVGWTLARHAWRQGYAQETARAAMAWAWANLQTPRLISVIQVGNERSIHVAERLGMVLVREDVHEGVPVVIYAIERPAPASS